MPVTLPNGLVCPEKEDNNDAACEQIKDLFRAVDLLQTLVGTSGTQTATKILQNVSASNWVLNGPAVCKQYEQVVTTPLGVNTAEMLVNIYNSLDKAVHLSYEVVGPNTIRIKSNKPDNYKVVYA